MYGPHGETRESSSAFGQYYNKLNMEGRYDHAIRLNISSHCPANNIPSGNWLLEIKKGEWSWNQSCTISFQYNCTSLKVLNPASSRKMSQTLKSKGLTILQIIGSHPIYRHLTFSAPKKSKQESGVVS